MQPVAEIRVHAIDLSHFGKTPTGDSLFRVVWGPSRVEKVWFRQTLQIREMKMYPTAEGWVLEKWLSAEEYAGSREMHEERQKKMPINIDYPAGGEYVECMQFPDNDTVSMAPQCVEWLLYGSANLSEKDRIRAIKLREELKEKDEDARISDLITDVLGTPQWSGKRVNLYDAAGNIIH